MNFVISDIGWEGDLALPRRAKYWKYSDGRLQTESFVSGERQQGASGRDGQEGCGVRKAKVDIMIIRYLPCQHINSEWGLKGYSYDDEGKHQKID